MVAGLTRYFTGVACPRGHVAERLVSTRACHLCMREKKHAWLANNPDKANAQKRAYCKANPVKVKGWKSDEQKRNRAAANARNKRYEAKHPDKKRARTAAWAKANLGKVVAKAARYRAAKLLATPLWANQVEIQKVYDLASRFRSLGCDFHVDHKIPLQSKLVCGLHVHNNLHIIEANANRSKSNYF